MNSHYLNDTLGIKMWNNGEFNHLHAGAILKRVESIPTGGIELTAEDIRRLEQEQENQKERFIDKYGRSRV